MYNIQSNHSDTIFFIQLKTDNIKRYSHKHPMSMISSQQSPNS